MLSKTPTLYFLLLIASFNFCASSLLAQKNKLKQGLAIDKANGDAATPVVFSRDTLFDGSAYTSIYNVTAVSDFAKIVVDHYPNDSKIIISTYNSTEKSPIDRTVKYLIQGGYIITNWSDTVFFKDEDENKSVLFFSSKEKDRYVYLNSITSFTNESPKTLIYLDPISPQFKAESNKKVEDYQLKGTPERKLRYKQKQDSIKLSGLNKKNQDSLEIVQYLQKQANKSTFLKMRDSTFIEVSSSYLFEYSNLVKEQLTDILNNMPAEDFYYKARYRFYYDTTGVLKILEAIKPETSGKNPKDFYNLFYSKSKSNIIRTMRKEDENYVSWSMNTTFELPIDIKKKYFVARCYLSEKEKTFFDDETKNNSKLKLYIDDTLANRKGKFKLWIYKSEIQGETRYKILKIKGNDSKSLAHAGVSFGNFVNNDLLNYNTAKNFPYINVSFHIRFVGVYIASNIFKTGSADKGNKFSDLPDSSNLNIISTTYFKKPNYLEYGIYLSPSHLFYLKAGMASLKNIFEVIQYENSIGEKENSFKALPDKKGITIGLSFVPKYFLLEAGYNTLMKQPYFNAGLNFPFSLSSKIS